MSRHHPIIHCISPAHMSSMGSCPFRLIVAATTLSDTARTQPAQSRRTARVGAVCMGFTSYSCCRGLGVDPERPRPKQAPTSAVRPVRMCPSARYAENHARWGHGREPGPLSPGCSSSVAANTCRLARSRESMLRWAKLRLRSKWSCLLVVYAESGRKWGHGLQPMLATLMLWALLAPAAR